MVTPLIAPLLGGLLGGGSSSGSSGGASSGSSSTAGAEAASVLPLLAQAGAAQGGNAPGVLGAAVAPRGPSVGEQVGSSAAGAFLAQQLARVADRPDPAAQAGLQELGRRAAQEPITQNQERVSRELVQQVKDALGPELAQIRQMAQDRALQVQATALRRLEQNQQRAAAAGGRRY